MAAFTQFLGLLGTLLQALLGALTTWLGTGLLVMALMVAPGCSVGSAMRLAAASNIGPFHSKVYAHAHPPQDFAFSFNISETPISSEVTVGPVTVGSELGWAGNHSEFAGLGIVLEPLVAAADPGEGTG